MRQHGCVILLPQFSKPLITRVFRYILHADWFPFFCSSACNALSKLEPDLADCLFPETRGRPEYQLLPIPQIYRRDIHTEPLCRLLHNSLKDIIQFVVRTGKHAYLFKGHDFHLFPVCPLHLKDKSAAFIYLYMGEGILWVVWIYYLACCRHCFKLPETAYAYEFYPVIINSFTFHLFAAFPAARNRFHQSPLQLIWD